MQLGFNGRSVPIDSALGTDIRDMGSVTLSTGTYLYTATSAPGGLVVYRVDGTAPPSIADQHFYTDAQRSILTGDLGIVQIGGQTHLMFANPNTGHNTGLNTAISVTLNANGSLAGFTQNPLSSLGVEQFAYADAPNTLYTSLTANSTNFIITANQTTHQVTSYSASPNAMTQIDTMGAVDGLGIQVPTAIQAITAFGQSWVIVASQASNSLSVLQLNSSGTLTPTDHVIDSQLTRFGDVHAMEVLSVEGRVLIFAGGGDDGLSMLELLPSGQLLHHQSIIHEVGLGLQDVSAIAAVVVGGHVDVFVSSEGDSGVSQFSFVLSDLGQVVQDTSGASALHNGTGQDDLLISLGGTADTLSGGAGDDVLVAGPANTIMIGGDGADRFVLQGGAYQFTVRDFQAGVDILDLSQLPFLRNPDQLTLQETNWGARIDFAETTIFIQSATGGPLTSNSIFGLTFTWPDRALVLTTTPSLQLKATPQGGRLEGSIGDDTAIGQYGNDAFFLGIGNDIAYGNEGDDTLSGGQGDDFLSSGGGNDIAYGGTGKDTLSGGIGNDKLWGDAGADQIWAGEGDDTVGSLSGDTFMGLGPGNDIAFGGSGGDTVQGNGGDDKIWGNDGWDLLRGEVGNDTINGGRGNDSLSGSDGNDVILGGEGADRIFAGADQDQIWGGDWADLIFTGSGNDKAYGENGSDTIWGGLGMDSLYGQDQGDRIYGGPEVDIVDGGNGSDSIGGGPGDDIMKAGTGNDIVFGGDDDDIIFGNTGNDRLYGGGGDDTMTGGADSDIFLFSFDKGHDQITDFELAKDLIHVFAPQPMLFTDLNPSANADGDVILSFGSGQVVLDGISLDSLGALHVVFG